MNKWQKIWQKRFSVRLGENWLSAARYFQEDFGVPFPEQVIVINNEVGTGYIYTEQFKELLEGIYHDLQATSFATLYEQKAIPRMEAFLEHCKAPSKLEPGLSSGELYHYWADLIEEEDKWMSPMWLIFLLDEFLSEKLRSRLSDESALEAVYTPFQPTAALNFRTDLIKAVISGNWENEKYSLLNRYAYFPFLNLDEEPAGLELVEEPAKVLFSRTKVDLESELMQIEKKRNEHLQAYEDLQNKCIDDKELSTLLDACHKVAYYREYRNDIRQQSYFYLKDFYQLLATTLHTQVRWLVMATHEEVGAALRGEAELPASEILEERRKFIGLRGKNGQILYLKDSSQLPEGLEETVIVSNVSELKGVPAFAGVVQGTVKVVRNIVEDAQKVNEGDILVAPTTNLSFIPIITRAAAIVTDDGGMLCHAAIVAREMHKPCIVGTKYASVTLKDGDRVEVNATKGSITILS